MKQPFLLRQMRGRAPVCIGVAVLNFALALLLSCSIRTSPA